MSLYVNKLYDDFDSTPMMWNKFNLCIRTWLQILSTTGAAYKMFNNDFYFYGSLCVLYILMWSAFYIYMTDWNIKAYYLIIALDIFNIFWIFRVIDEYTIVRVIGLFIITYLEYVYYKKRILFFEGRKEKKPSPLQEYLDSVSAASATGSTNIQENDSAFITTSASKSDNLKVESVLANDSVCSSETKDSIVVSQSFKAFNSQATVIQPKQNFNNILTDKPEIKYCRKCGTRLDKNALFCKKCGTKVIKL